MSFGDSTCPKDVPKVHALGLRSSFPSVFFTVTDCPVLTKWKDLCNIGKSNHFGWPKPMWVSIKCINKQFSIITFEFWEQKKTES